MTNEETIDAQPVNVGVVGCGNISSVYLQNSTASPYLNVLSCADIDMQRAAAQAKRFKVPRVQTPDELIADTDIELVVNLTVPAAHSTVGLAAIRAGKSVYNEKPLATTLEDGQRMLTEAQERGVRVGCAPDTFLGGGLQTCRALLDEGVIGQPVAATAFMLQRGPESWHPDPDFFYQEGAGPLFDMGPYYLTTLISMLGPVRRVTGSARISFPERVIGSQPKRGTKIKVTTPTHIAGVLDFEMGAIATLVTSFDVWNAEVPRIEIYGSDGTMILPDPNGFGGPVRIWRWGSGDWGDWQEAPLIYERTGNIRGIGVEEMAQAMRTGRAHRANGEMAYHVLDIMHSILDGSKRGRHIELSSTCERPEPLPRKA